MREITYKNVWEKVRTIAVFTVMVEVAVMATVVVSVLMVMVAAMVMVTVL